MQANGGLSWGWCSGSVHACMVGGGSVLAEYMHAWLGAMVFLQMHSREQWCSGKEHACMVRGGALADCVHGSSVKP